MKELLKLVAVGIELTVEILCYEPVGVEKLFGTGKAESAEKKNLEFII